MQIQVIFVIQRHRTLPLSLMSALQFTLACMHSFTFCNISQIVDLLSSEKAREAEKKAWTESIEAITKKVR